MDRSYMLNDYVNDNEKSLKDRDESLGYLEGLKFRLNGCKTITQLMVEVSKFLEMNDIPKEIEAELINICNSFDENMDVSIAQSKLVDYLSNRVDSDESKYQQTNETATDVKTDLIDDAKTKLDEVGIDLNENNDDVIDNIKDEDDVDRIINNVDTATDYFYEQNKIIPEEEKDKIVVPLDIVNDVVDSSEDDIILNAALENQEKVSTIENPSMFQSNDDGSIQLNGDITNQDSLNFVAMMTMSLLTTVPGKDIYDLNMKFIKEKEEVNKFKVLYGNFPLVDHPENKLDLAVVSRIMELANTYDTNVNYMRLLGETSPELKEALTFAYENILGKPGAFQMAIKNTENNHDMMFGMDDNYNKELTALGDSGAYVSHDANQYGMASIKEHTPGNQLVILSSANEMLDEKKNLDEGLTNNRQYVKKLEDSEAANVNYTLLITILVTEALLIGSYFVFTMIK